VWSKASVALRTVRSSIAMQIMVSLVVTVIHNPAKLESQL